MAKKPFQYDRDAETPWIPNAPRASRAEREQRPRRARALAERLVGMRPSERGELDLDAGLRAALDELERIPPKKHAARKRKLGHIGALVEAHDLDAIEAVLEAVAIGQSEREARIDALVRWRTRLLDDPGALTAFFDAHPNSDRQRVRQLVGAARKARGTPSQKKADRVLLDAMKSGNLDPRTQ